jgi:hypothetical protein
MHLTKADIILIVLLCVGSLTTLGFRFLESPVGDYALIEVADGEVLKLELDAPRVVEVRGLRGVTTVEVTADRRVRVLESACSGKHCIKAGAISEAGELIVCVPNGVCISISGDERKRRVDAVVH